MSKAKLHPGIPEQDYIDLPGVRVSTLKRCLDNPHAAKDPWAGSDAMLLGSLVHCMVLEPDKVEERYAVCEIRRDARTKAYQEFLAENEGKEILTNAIWNQATSMAEGVKAHPAIAYIETAKSIECGITFDVNGLLVKGKADVIVYDEDGVLCILDVKTTRDASKRNFARDCARMHYGMQLAAYGYGVAKAIDADPLGFRYLVLAVENNGTPRVACWELDAESVVFGLEQLNDAALAYTEQDEAGWPVNYNENFEPISLPKW